MRECASTAMATFVVLLGITIATQLVRFLGLAAGGSITFTGVFALLAFASFNYLPVLLSLTLFIAVLMTLTRSYRDSEMIVWLGSGVSLTGWIRPVLSFAVPVVILIALLSLLLSPWAITRSEEFRSYMDNRDDASQVTPGVFRESKQSERVFFVENVNEGENMVANVFVSSTQHQKIGVMVAKRGFLQTSEYGDRFLVLLNGRRYEGLPGMTEYKISEFERYAMRIEAREAKASAPSAKSLSTLDLLRNPNPIYLGELAWRIGLPLSALVLALLAIPLSFVNPRAGRSLNLVMAILVYMIYNNFLSIAQAWVAQQRISLPVGLWSVHAVMLVLLLLLFFRRLTLFSIFRYFKSPRA
ncbi:MAG: LPS export ABC transporter permease LptF [Betaproteobacteria bacterium]|nr:LPS export ABC transporter permease LptF [Betaproteobacteria bacterium]